MKHATSAVAPLDPDLIEVGDAIGQRAQRRPAIAATCLATRPARSGWSRYGVGESGSSAARSTLVT